MADNLYNLLNDFYSDIRPDLAEAVLSAIRAADRAGEFESRIQIITSLSQLITLLSNPHFDSARAINIYMAETRGSVTRPFFYHMTLRANLFPEDHLIPLPPAPPALPPLQRSLALPASFVQIPPRIDLPDNFYDFPEQMPPPMFPLARAPAVDLLPNEMLPNVFES